MRRLLALFLPLALIACGGGGGGGGPTEPPPPQPAIVVTPAAAPSPGVAIASGAGTTPSTLILEIRANSVTDLYGVAFDLRYPSNILQLVQVNSGTFLGNATLQASPAQGQGTGLVVIGLSKLGSVSGASGSGVLMTVELRAIAAGEGSFSFEQNSAINSSGQPISGFGWAAGTVRVTR